MHLILVTVSVFTLCTLALVYLRAFAIRLNFVDVPNGRKSHNGHIPVIGGLATLLGVWIVHLFMPDLIPYQSQYMCLATMLVIVGLVDDKLDISAVSRLIVIGAVSAWLVYVEDISLSYLGNLTGNGEIYLGNWALLFTMAAVIGCVTAFNMIDGIDGLLGSLASISIAGLGVLFWYSGNTQVMTFCFLFIVAMMPYVLFNLGLKVKSRYKVFMGDSGSFLVGFSVIWLLVFATQKIDTPNINIPSMKPVTSLWMISVPLMDMTLVMIRRLIKRQSPFKADRSHIHHIMQATGFTPRQVLLRVSALALVTAVVGIVIDISHVREVVSFCLFLALFFSYSCWVLAMEYRSKVRLASELTNSVLSK